MAAGPFTLYSNALQEMTTGAFNLPNDTYVMTLLTNAYVPSPNTDTVWSDISANELTNNGGYVTGGTQIADMTSTQANGTVTVTCGQVVWSAFTATYQYGAIVRQAGATLAPTDLLLCFFNSGSVTGDGGLMTVTPAATGLFQITHTP